MPGGMLPDTIVQMSTLPPKLTFSNSTAFLLLSMMCRDPVIVLAGQFVKSPISAPPLARLMTVMSPPKIEPQAVKVKPAPVGPPLRSVRPCTVLL